MLYDIIATHTGHRTLAGMGNLRGHLEGKSPFTGFGIFD